MWALGSFPFLLLNVPILGASLTGHKPTGYDQAGRLVPMLTGAQKKEMQRLEEMRHLSKARNASGGQEALEAPDALKAAALAVQRTYRGWQVRNRGLVTKMGAMTNGLSRSIVRRPAASVAARLGDTSLV